MSGSSSMSGDEFEFTVLEWLSNVSEIVIDNFSNLQDGIVLIRSMNAICPDYIRKYYEVGHNEKHPYPFLERENLNLYIESCWKMGLPSHNIFTPTEVFDTNSDVVYTNLSTLSHVVQFLSRFCPKLKPIQTIGNSSYVESYSVFLFDILSDEYEFSNEELELQSTSCQMMKEILDSLISGGETDMDAVEAITEYGFAIDSVRRVFVYLLQSKVFQPNESPKEMLLDSNGFSILATLTGALLEDLNISFGGDYYTAKLLFNLSYFFKTNPENTEGIYLHEVIREHKLWENMSFWTEIYWDKLTSFVVPQLTENKDFELTESIMNEILVDHLKKMLEWGKFSVEILGTFAETFVSPEEAERLLEEVMGAKNGSSSETDGDTDDEDSEIKKEDSEAELNASLVSDILQLKVTVKRQEQHIQKLEETLTQQFTKTITACHSEKLKDKLNHAHKILKEQLTQSSGFKSETNEILKNIQKIKENLHNLKKNSIGNNVDFFDSLDQLQELHDDIHEKVLAVLENSRKMVESEDMEPIRPELRSEMYEVLNDMEDASGFYLDALSTALSDANSQIFDHIGSVSKEFELSLADFIQIVDKVLIELRLELSGVVIEAIVTQLEGEAEILRKKNNKLMRRNMAEEEKLRVKELEKQLEALRISEQSAKLSETQLLSEKVKLIEEQSNQVSLIFELTKLIEDRDKTIEDQKHQIEQYKKELDELREKKAKTPKPPLKKDELEPPDLKKMKLMKSTRAKSVSKKNFDIQTDKVLPLQGGSVSARGNNRSDLVLTSVVKIPDSASPEAARAVSYLDKENKEKKTKISLTVLSETEPEPKATEIKDVELSPKPEAKKQTENMKEKLQNTANKNRKFAQIVAREISHENLQKKSKLFAKDGESDGLSSARSVSKPIKIETLLSPEKIIAIRSISTPNGSSPTSNNLSMHSTSEPNIMIPYPKSEHPNVTPGEPPRLSTISSVSNPSIVEEPTPEPAPPPVTLANISPIIAKPISLPFLVQHKEQHIRTNSTPNTITEFEGQFVSRLSPNSTPATPLIQTHITRMITTPTQTETPSVLVKATTLPTKTLVAPNFNVPNIPKLDQPLTAQTHRPLVSPIRLPPDNPNFQSPNPQTPQAGMSLTSRKHRPSLPVEGNVLALKSKFSKFEEFKIDRRLRATRGISGINLKQSAPDYSNEEDQSEILKLKFLRLSDVEFVRLFKMTRMQFNRLPVWKAENLKKKAGFM